MAGIIGGICIILLFVMPICYVQSIEVVGSHYYDEETIIEVSKIECKHLLDINDLFAKKRLEALPYVAQAEIKYDFPGKIQIHLSEKAPFAYAQFKGTFLCINKQGQVIEQTQKTHHKVPIITGLVFDYFVDNETLPIKNQEDWLVAQQLIQGLNEFEYASKVSKIDVHNIEEIHLYVDKLDVIMGDIGDFGKKIETLIVIHEEKGYTMGQLDLSGVNTKLNAVYLKPSR